MSLYECESCGCVENTATGSYWGMTKKLCSECDTGTWHGIFAKKSAKGMLIDNQGFLYSDKTAELCKHIKMVGRV